MFDTMVQAFSGLLSAVIGALFALVVFRGGKQSDVAREQLNKVYAKSFRLIEPAMYQNIPREDCDRLVTQLYEIATSGGILTDPQLMLYLNHYKSAPAGDNCDYPNFKYHTWARVDCYLTDWYIICSHIDRNYDILCRKAFLPVRKLDYRLEKNQYINRSIWMFNFLRFNWQIITLFLVLLVLTLLQMLQIGR